MVAQAVLREPRAAEAFEVEFWDLALGADFDLTRRSVRQRLISDARQGLLIGAMLVPPCSSFSIAQHGALRSKDHPWGLPSLSGDKLQKVVVGNALVRSAFSLARAFSSSGTPWILEHPHNSYVWQTQEIADIIGKPMLSRWSSTSVPLNPDTVSVPGYCVEIATTSTSCLCRPIAAQPLMACASTRDVGIFTFTVLNAPAARNTHPLWSES